MAFAQPNMFCFVDETAKDRNAARRRRSWGPRGEDNDVSKLFNPLGAVRYTMLAAADINGFVRGAIDVVQREHGVDDADPTRGTIDTERFLEWVEFFLVPTLGKAVTLEDRSVIVMDNATIHMDPRVRLLIEGEVGNAEYPPTGAILIYTAPFSPDLNPIEFCFHQYKACLKRNPFLCRLDWRKAHTHALGSVSRLNMCAYYRKIGCIRNVPAEARKEQDLIGAIFAVAAVVFWKRRRLC